jgi:uncharacterized protein (TIGR03083 family)
VDKDAVWAAIDSQRLRTADLLEGLSEEQWRHPSLCDGWTVRDVAAHLTLQQVRLGQALLVAVKHPGGLNRSIRDSARSRANLPVDQLVAGIRTMVGSRRHNIGVSYLETLIDILVHGQDIAIPLELNLEMLPAATAVAATRVWSYGGKGKARVFHKIPFQGFRLTATDISWSAGEGTEILAPISAILLLLTGRLAALPQMTGPGVEVLHRQLLRD